MTDDGRGFVAVQALGYFNLAAGLGLSLAATQLPTVAKAWTQVLAILALGLAIGFLTSYVIARPRTRKPGPVAAGTAIRGGI